MTTAALTSPGCQTLLALQAAVRSHPITTALVLGSGLGKIAERVTPLLSFRFEDCSSLAATRVDGHAGRVILGEWKGQRLLLFNGRNHFYEGHPWDRVVAPVRLAASLGVRQLLLTNAAGGIRDDLTPGTLMAITDHLDLTRPNSWNRPFRTNGHSPYSQNLLASLQAVARRFDICVSHGTYAAVIGPNYETPAEIRAFRALGADAVGMSTAREAREAFELGLECLAISCITNRAAGLSPTRLSHEEVLLHSQQQAARLGDLLEGLLPALG